MAGHSDNDMGLPQFDKPVKIAIVIAPYYTAIATAQIAAATAVLDRAGATHEVIEVPGSLEIATAIGTLKITARTGTPITGDPAPVAPFKIPPRPSPIRAERISLPLITRSFLPLREIRLGPRLAWRKPRRADMRGVL